MAFQLLQEGSNSIGYLEYLKYLLIITRLFLSLIFIIKHVKNSFTKRNICIFFDYEKSVSDVLHHNVYTYVYGLKHM